MDYARFKATGIEDWEAAASLMERSRRHGLSSLSHEEVEGLAALHRRVVSDFAYARTHFAGTEAVADLRRLAFEGHRILAARHEPALPRVARFVTTDFPELFRRSVPTLAAAVGLFAAASLLGFVLTVSTESFAHLFLGPEAIEGLRSGRIWTDSVSSAAPPSVTASRILTNNMSVALLAWAGGMLAGLLTLWVLVLNGVMFGSVIALTWRYELFDRLLAFVAAHGPLELFLITVAAAAGLELAAGQIRADNRPRGVAFREHARRSVQLVVGTLPWFFLLGVVEGYVSPEMGLSTGLKGLLGLLLLAAFVAYASGAFRPRGARGAS
jgi:uncharacterized membrane protein SpoIIM required for sporulation